MAMPRIRKHDRTTNKITIRFLLYGNDGLFGFSVGLAVAISVGIDTLSCMKAM